MFITGQRLASNPVVCWANADIIFTPTIMRAAQVVTDHPAPGVPRRSSHRRRPAGAPRLHRHGWVAATSPDAPRAKASASRRTGSTTSCSRAGSSCELPPFAIGRPGYDPWLIWRAADLGADVVDATRLRARGPPTSRLLTRRDPRRRVQWDRGAAERRDRRRLAALPLDQPRPAQAGRRRASWFRHGGQRIAWLGRSATPRTRCASPARSVSGCSASRRPVAALRGRLRSTE